MPIEKKAASGIKLTLLLMGSLMLAFNVQQANSLETPLTEWSRTYGGTANDRAYSVVQASDGGYALAGGTDSYGAGNVDVWLVKTDSVGNQLWNKTYGGTDYDYDYSVVQTSDG